MLPEPLHPAIVHFPIVLATILPLAAISAWLLIRRGNPVRKAWTPVLILAVLLSGSAFAAVRTGEAEEEVVESVVGEAPIHEHEEAAELFLPLSFGVLGIVAAGLLTGRLGNTARGLAALASISLLVAGYRVGHTGGELVYQHGAAQAYTATTSGQGRPGVSDEHALEESERADQRSEEHR